MALSDVKETIKQHEIDKKLAKRQLRIEYAKGAVIVFVFLVGLALVSNLNNIYFAVNYGFGSKERPWYSNFVLLFSILAYLALFVSVYKKLGFKVTDKIDDLNTILDSLD
ncbi:hypothetical protein E4K67_13545 [Desulfosporosinus fructosivorans]|uniref:Uncharacterized protein n=1 Tax=Desulfosporosinus fructosivorans TaxID=2018669 RepID=A0A4Z0R5W3_9FIRM|nr:hypothetical protein [Desulfosporosinus fructosivorans]TGE37735.1 hypothetical protein E4K67_13545 [Desulfosporosinus fructosivorans]